MKMAFAIWAFTVAAVCVMFTVAFIWTAIDAETSAEFGTLALMALGCAVGSAVCGSCGATLAESQQQHTSGNTSRIGHVDAWRHQTRCAAVTKPEYELVA